MALPGLGDVELGAVNKIPFEVALQFLSKSLAVEHRIQLIIDAEAADVDVRRPDRADRGVDADRLGVQVPFW